MTLSYVLELNWQTQSFSLTLQTMDRNDFLNRFPKIKSSDILPEFPSLDLRIVQQVLDHGSHHLGGSMLNICSCVQFI